MNRIKNLRIANNISQAELGNKVNASNQAISAYESGFRNPKPETWQALADFFNVSVPYLQGKIFKEDLSPELQDMFDDIQDLVTLIVPDYAVERVLTALINSHKYNYSNDGWD
ncbi:helix-turn-helix transcriptional regulator [Lactobacillus paragasseri]|uniref:HTH cro/C1-type domain-containing protein n=1 Tax=Lactobacillus paragasseri TaxID=2107999 RepID=A0ABQ0N131_9LACO|nr:helix-turn-helix transcriptional regulator [Lactobacillus paragasseri]NP_050133.1 DNA binding protein [Lactobacillus phage phiadh]MBT1276955.1 hypothetical protein [Lactobacillus paragasseri]WRS91587.1 helix-turn-helix transcriptional regulator [Lactobacillus paragasseri]CAB52503.1 hypothetical protein [Lactobacillus phage phiadh]GBA80274.1 hypothetical protein LJCM1130_02540 [Lactobacillus paragasseri]